MRKAFLAACLASTLFVTGCLGPNNAQNSVRNWNAEISEMDWLNELLYLFPLGFVQSLALWADALIFNTIDYWSGNNPINDPGAFPDSFSNG